MSKKENGKDIDGNIAWVVGVGPVLGTGAAIAKRFAKEGLVAVVTGRSIDALERVVREIEADGGEAVAMPGDATHEEDMLSILTWIEARGPLEVGVYNAGNAQWAPTLEFSSARFEEVWRVGCLGGFTFGREVARAMQSREKGTILFTGATASLRGKPNFAAFSSAKAGLRMVSQSLAREFHPQGIHVAHVVIDGSIHGEKILTRFPDLVEKKGPDGLLSVSAIADAFWNLHQQPRSAWSQEIDLRPFAELF
jgi:NAD(P)-dependent dehydrogenase (short-subunit alcohol dehydrogenase family)